MEKLQGEVDIYSEFGLNLTSHRVWYQPDPNQLFSTMLEHIGQCSFQFESQPLLLFAGIIAVLLGFGYSLSTSTFKFNPGGVVAGLVAFAVLFLMYIGSKRTTLWIHAGVRPIRVAFGSNNGESARQAIGKIQAAQNQRASNIRTMGAAAG